MTELEPFPDVEAALADFIVRQVPALADAPNGRHRVGYVTPRDVAALVGGDTCFVEVSVFGGDDEQLRTSVVVDVFTIGKGREAARSMSAKVAAAILAYPWRVGAVLIDSVSGSAHPVRVPWDDEHLWRYKSSHKLSLRRG